MLSIITTTHGHRTTIQRTIGSVLGQTFEEFELLIVDDGARYDLDGILRSFNDPRIRLFRHPHNLGPSAARNTGLDNIRGEWFTILDDDDELLGNDALEHLLSIPHRIDPAIDAITCNCRDSVTGEFTGRGLSGDTYLDWKTILSQCHGEFWGITRTSLLGTDRFHAKARGQEQLLWHKINKRARRFYTHRACRIWHTEGEQRLTREKVSSEGVELQIYQSYRALMSEGTEYLEDLRAYAPSSHAATLYNAGLAFIYHNDRRRSLHMLREMLRHDGHYLKKAVLTAGALLGRPLLKGLRSLKHALLRLRALIR